MKRFTDTAKWFKPWFRELNPTLKCLWLYICDNCDVAGIWTVDFKLASMFIGEPLDEKAVLQAFAKQITVVDNKRWLIHDFCNFQYGVRTDKNKNTIKAVEGSLLKYGISMDKIWCLSKELNSPSQAPSEGVERGMEAPQVKEELSFHTAKGLKANANTNVHADANVHTAKDSVREKPDVAQNAPDSRHELINGFFKSIWKHYPRPIGQQVALSNYHITLKGVANNELANEFTQTQKALENYLNSDRVKNKHYIQDGRRWFAEWRGWVDYKDAQDYKPKPRSSRSL